MTFVRAVLIGLEGETLEERAVRWPPPAVLEIAFTKPITALQEWMGDVPYVVVPFDYHHAHEITEDGVETVALYIRRGIC